MNALPRALARLSGSRVTRTSSDQNTSMTVRRAGRTLCFAGAAIGLLGIVGSLSGVTVLRTVMPGQPPIMMNTAVALVLLGVAAALRRDESIGAGRRAALLVAASL